MKRTIKDIDVQGKRVFLTFDDGPSETVTPKILEILEPSNKRKKSDCDTYKRCGGCDLRHIKYEETLKMKQNAIQSLVNKTLNKKINVEETLRNGKSFIL